MEATEPFNYSLPVLAVWYLLPPFFLLLRNYNKSPITHMGKLRLILSHRMGTYSLGNHASF